MFITYRQNRYTHRVNVKLTSVAKVIQLMNKLGYSILKVGE